MPLEDYELLGEIGSGTFGVVSRFECLSGIPHP